VCFPASTYPKCLPGIGSLTMWSAKFSGQCNCSHQMRSPKTKIKKPARSRSSLHLPIELITVTASTRPSPNVGQYNCTRPVGSPATAIPRGPLSAEERQRRHDNLCLYCGNGGHLAQNCPNTSSSAPSIAGVPRTESIRAVVVGPYDEDSTSFARREVPRPYHRRDPTTCALIYYLRRS